MLDTAPEWIAAVALLITFSTLLGNVLYRSGHLAARVEALETWRGNIRNDMHEISKELGILSGQVASLITVVEERTDRRLDNHAVADERRSKA